MMRVAEGARETTTKSSFASRLPLLLPPQEQRRALHHKRSSAAVNLVDAYLISLRYDMQLELYSLAGHYTLLVIVFYLPHLCNKVCIIHYLL